MKYFEIFPSELPHTHGVSGYFPLMKINFNKYFNNMHTLRSGHYVFKNLKTVKCVKPYTKSIKLPNSVAWVRKQTLPTERPPLVSEFSAKFADRGCHEVSVTDPYGRIIGFLDRSRYSCSRGLVNPVPDTLLLRKSSSAGNLNQDLWACTQKLWPLDHRDGHGQHAHRINTHKLPCLEWDSNPIPLCLERGKTVHALYRGHLGT
jgi:hypothetical protein